MNNKNKIPLFINIDGIKKVMFNTSLNTYVNSPIEILNHSSILDVKGRYKYIGEVDEKDRLICKSVKRLK